MIEDCRHCEGRGAVVANGAVRQCPTCDGYGYVGHALDEYSTKLSLLQTVILLACSGFVILVLLFIGNRPW